ncbi:hypothetical protein [Bradyrhizobium sp. CCBAU 53380]|uniref:hypothetical protein n=1 Tax=Bradyrhizobium sp. CCBAU 53380 TaxID=1325117 RepID=UPI002303FD81|nr:hypothetical protein [Bradyrhizobium sp. CCBAU 53380]MDA9424864.1 hypothetical protein [Bradyrhizobium sp. CCBAU 53380]
MALDINRPLIERTWVLPRIRQLLPIAEKYDARQPIAFATEAIGDFSLALIKTGARFRPILSVRNERFNRLAIFLRRLYPEFFAGVFKPIEPADFIDEELITKRFELAAESKRKKSEKSRSIRGRELRLTPDDDSWIGETNVGAHFDLFRRSVISLGRYVQKSVADDEKTGKTLLLLK